MLRPSYSAEAFERTTREEVLLAKRLAPLVITPDHVDIGLVWGVSSTGTVYEAANLGPDNPYSGIVFDRAIVDEGARIVRDITALRTGKYPEDIKPIDIERHGPSLLYNGEYPGMDGGKFPNQIPHFEDYVETEGFMVPRSNIVVGWIEQPNTPDQVRQLAGVLREDENLQHFAAVCGVGHSVRVGRYIQHARKELGIISEDICITAAFVAQADRDTHIAALETRKAMTYLEKGDLSIESAFFTAK